MAENPQQRLRSSYHPGWCIGYIWQDLAGRVSCYTLLCRCSILNCPPARKTSPRRSLVVVSWGGVGRRKDPGLLAITYPSNIQKHGEGVVSLMWGKGGDTSERGPCLVWYVSTYHKVPGGRSERGELRGPVHRSKRHISSAPPPLPPHPNPPTYAPPPPTPYLRPSTTTPPTPPSPETFQGEGRFGILHRSSKGLYSIVMLK